MHPFPSISHPLLPWPGARSHFDTWYLWAQRDQTQRRWNPNTYLGITHFPPSLDWQYCRRDLKQSTKTELWYSSVQATMKCVDSHRKNQWMHQWELLLLVHQHRYNPITLLKFVTRRSVITVTWSKCYQTPVVKFGHSTPTQQFVRTKTINPYRLTIKDTGNTILIGSGGFKGLIWNSQEKLENKPKKVE